MEHEAGPTRPTDPWSDPAPAESPAPSPDGDSDVADGTGAWPTLAKVAVVVGLVLAVVVSGATSIYLARELSDARADNRALAIKSVRSQQALDDSTRRQVVLLAGMRRLLNGTLDATGKTETLKSKTQAALAGMQSLLAETQTTLDSTNQTVADVNDLLAQLEQGIAKMQGVAGSLRSANVADLGSRVPAVQASADAVQARFNSMSDSMQRRLPDLRARVDALPDSDRKTRVQGAVKAMQSAVAAHTERVTGAIHVSRTRSWTSDSASTGSAAGRRPGR
jgi:uncharacterized phage infection (PIP) family protein YhgE